MKRGFWILPGRGLTLTGAGLRVLLAVVNIFTYNIGVVSGWWVTRVSIVLMR